MPRMQFIINKSLRIVGNKKYKYKIVRKEFYRKVPNEKNTPKYTDNIKQNLPYNLLTRI